MLYLLQFEGFVKFGWAKRWPQRAMRGFWHLKHPPELCGKLDNYEIIKLFEGGSEEFEKSVHKSFKGVGEFYPETLLPKLLEMLTDFEESPIPFTPKCQLVVKKACCGGTKHVCFGCSTTFSRREHLMRLSLIHISEPTRRP